MTRETKVGLVVSASFVCLLVAVFYCKLKEANQTATAQALHDASGSPVPADPAPAGPAESNAWAIPAGAGTPSIGSGGQPNLLDPHIQQATRIDTPSGAPPGGMPAAGPPLDKAKELGASTDAN